VACGEVAQHAYQRPDLIAGARDVVPAAEVDPLHARQQVAELILESGDGALERRQVVLEQRVEVKARSVLKSPAATPARGVPSREPGAHGS